MRGNKQTTERAKTFAKGGSTKMFGRQAAGPDKPGNTGKDQSHAPGKRFAEGGTKKLGPRSSQPARRGHTSAR
jgi:hypothetical protein